MTSSLTRAVLSRAESLSVLGAQPAVAFRIYVQSISRLKLKKFEGNISDILMISSQLIVSLRIFKHNGAISRKTGRNTVSLPPLTSSRNNYPEMQDCGEDTTSPSICVFHFGNCIHLEAGSTIHCCFEIKESESQSCRGCKGPLEGPLYRPTFC